MRVISPTFAPFCQSDTFQSPPVSEFQTLATMHFASFMAEALAAKPNVVLPEVPNTCLAD